MIFTDEQEFWLRIDDIISNKLNTLSHLPENIGQLCDLIEKIEDLITNDNHLIQIIDLNENLFEEIWSKKNEGLDVVLTSKLFLYKQYNRTTNPRIKTVFEEILTKYKYGEDFPIIFKEKYHKNFSSILCSIARVCGGSRRHTTIDDESEILN